MRRPPSYSSTAFFLLILAMCPSVAMAQVAVTQNAQKVTFLPTTSPLPDSKQITSAFLGGSWEATRSFSGVWLLVIAIGLVQWFLSCCRRAALAATGIEEIDQMDGRSFEHRLAILFRQLGYSVDVTPYAGDWGGDLVLCKDGVKTVVQAKRYKKAVGVRAVQEAVAAKAKYGCAEAMVVTNSVYTRQARELARANRVTLWDRPRLVQALLVVKREASTTASSTGSLAASSNAISFTISGQNQPSVQAASTSAAASFFTQQTCFLCHKPVSEKVAAYCQANPARFGGRIYCFDHQKQAARLERTLQ